VKPRQRQLAFVLASLCVIGALAAVTIQSLRLERNELSSRAVAEHEASVRLVLWRMDSMLAPILAREAATPYYYYRPFFEANRVNEPAREMDLARAAKSGTRGEGLVPSPLMQNDSKLVKLYFEVDSSGLNSPQAPEGAFRKLAESNFISAYQIEDNRLRLNELQNAWRQNEIADAQRDAAIEERFAAGSGQGPEVSEPARPIAAAPGEEAEVAPMPAADSAVGWRAATEQSAAIAQQQLSNDYAQRANVAANSKLTQLEVERSVSQSRRAESGPKAEAETWTIGDAPDAAEDEGGVEGSRGEADEVRATNAADAKRDVDAAAPTAGAGVASPAEPAPSTPGLAAERFADAASEEVQAELAAPAMDLGTLLDRAGDRADASGSSGGAGSGEASPREPIQGPLEPRWLVGSDEPTLVLVRQVTTSGGPVTQGLWLNWPELRGALLELAADVFPSASIEPLPGGVANLPPDALNRCLATIPAELQVPAPSIPTPRVLSPVRVALSMAWLVALGAIAASGLALRSATELADRRGQFVTAVTHELRTPLTTFCLYSQMLADGMVRDADAQAQYHSTLHRESQRLTRIVESVLEYARLGKRKAHAKPEATSVAALLDASLPALRERCQGCGLELVDTREGDLGGAIRVDRATFDRILSNLVDNACKYAAGSEPARVELSASVSASTLEIRVRDFGPGISASEAKRIFDPFFRGAAHSDGATPGLGLGLALCKALAREMGGDLSVIQPMGGATSEAKGACFRLALPRSA
jgi:signal transduction histidine kinase